MLLSNGVSFHWILSYLWILYALYFITAALIWSGLFDKALEVKLQLRDGKISKERPASKLDYALCLSVFALLVLPPLAVKSAKMWFDRHPDATIALIAPGTSNPVPLNIPSAYISPASGDLYWQGLMGIPPRNIVLLARLWEMQPISLETRAKYRLDSYKQYSPETDEYNHHSPVADNLGLLEITLMNNSIYQQAYDVYTKFSNKDDAMRNLFTGSIRLSEPENIDGLNILTVGNLMLATPSEEIKNKFLIACRRSCHFYTTLESGLNVEITFNESLLKNWQIILDKASELINRLKASNK